MRTHRLVRSATLAAAASLVLGLGRSARAEDPPPGGPPAALPKAENAFLDGLVGSWDAAVKAHGTELKGTDRWSKVSGETAWLHELHVGEGADAFHGLGVVRMAPDGKAANLWWFDSMGKGAVWSFKGTVSADGFEFASDEGGMKATIALKKAEGGLAYRMTVDGEEAVAGTWKKSAKPVVEPEPKDGPQAKHPLVKAELGEWTIATTSMGQTYAGKARYRLGVGGHYVLEDYELVGGDEKHFGFGVSSVAEDGKTMRAWWFGNYESAPLVLAGPVTEKTWAAKGSHPMGEMAVDVKFTDAGMESVLTMGGMEVMKETYTRAKAK